MSATITDETFLGVVKMPAWSLCGSLLLALAVPAVGDRPASSVKARPKLNVIDLARREAYRMPAGRQPVALVVDDGPTLPSLGRDLRRVSPSISPRLAPIRDPGTESVRLLLRDRLARRPGALDARVEWRLSRAGSDLGLGGGLAKVVDTLLHD